MSSTDQSEKPAKKRKSAKAASPAPAATVVAYKGWRFPDPLDAILRMFPPKDWAAVVYGDCDARAVRMDDLEGSENVLWGSSRNITQREAKRRCAAFNCGC